jgi:hypothetical protein
VLVAAVQVAGGLIGERGIGGQVFLAEANVLVQVLRGASVDDVPQVIATDTGVPGGTAIVRVGHVPHVRGRQSAPLAVASGALAGRLWAVRQPETANATQRWQTDEPAGQSGVDAGRAGQRAVPVTSTGSDVPGRPGPGRALGPSRHAPATAREGLEACGISVAASDEAGP